MQYPTLEQIEAADRLQICEWYRFLESPGTAYIGCPEFSSMLNHEVNLMNHILARFKALGGMTPSISNAIGLES